MTAEALFAAVAGNLLVAAGLGLVAGLLGRSARRPGLAHAVWVLVLLKLLTPPVVTPEWRVLPAAPTPAVPDAPPSPAARLSLPVLPPDQPVPTVWVELPLAFVADPAAVSSQIRIDWPLVVLSVWAAGALAYLAACGWRAWRFARLLRFAQPAPTSVLVEVEQVAKSIGLRRAPRVRLVPGVCAPFVWAVGRPTLFLPAELLARLSADQRAAVIAHELAHVRRWDHWVRWLEVVVTAAYWWCPLIWLARRELRRLEEEASDAEATAARPDSAHTYAVAILDTLDLIAGTRTSIPATATGMGDARSLRRRLVLILDGNRVGRTPGWMRLGLLVLGVAVLAASPAPARVSAAIEQLISPRSVSAPVPATLEAVRFEPTPVKLDGWNQPVTAAASSPDGYWYMLAAGPDVYVFDRRRTVALTRYLQHPAPVRAVAFGPDPETQATACDDGTVRVWRDGECVQTLTGHAGWVRALDFTPDGRTLVTGGYDRTVRLWDTATGRQTREWTDHPAGLRAVFATPDGKSVVSAAADGTVQLRTLADGAVRTLVGHQGGVRAVDVSADGRRLATVGDDALLRLWTFADGKAVKVQLPDAGTAVRFSPEGRTVSVGTAAGHLLLIDAGSGQVRGYVGVTAGDPDPRPAHPAAVVGVGQAKDGLMSVGADGSARFWQAADKGYPDADYRGHPGTVAAVAVSPDGATVATAGADGSVRLWDARTGKERARLAGHKGGAGGVLFAAGGRQLVSVGADETVRVWDVGTGRAVRAVVFPAADLRLAVTPDGRRLIVGGPGLPAVSVIDVETGAVQKSLVGDAGFASAVALTPDGEHLATGHADGRLSLWHLATGQEEARTDSRDRRGPISGIAFHPNGSSAAVLADDPDRPTAFEVLVWTPADATVEHGRRPLTHPGPVTAAAYGAGGKVLVTAARDGNLYVWDTVSGRPVWAFAAHAGPAVGLALTPDGAAVLSAGDTVAKRWPMPEGAVK